MIVVPLQILANSADIILLENGPAIKAPPTPGSPGRTLHASPKSAKPCSGRPSLRPAAPAQGWFTWRDIFHLLDIICCCAILFPIVWSIKHLREAANTDGKAARNLQKLTLFRQFYVMARPLRAALLPWLRKPSSPARRMLPQVVSYIYFTRIVVYLLKSTTPYQYVWLSDCAGEMATLAFYCFTGCVTPSAGRGAGCAIALGGPRGAPLAQVQVPAGACQSILPFGDG